MSEPDLNRGTAWRCTDCAAGFDATTADSACWYRCGGQLLPTREIHVREEAGRALRERVRSALLGLAEFGEPFTLEDVMQEIETCTGGCVGEEDTTQDDTRFVALTTLEQATEEYLRAIEEEWRRLAKILGVRREGGR